MDMQRKEKPSAHFILIPLMAQGHMIPMVDIALLLSSQGAPTTLITTPLNAARFTKTAQQIQSSNLPLRLISLPFPCREAGLPPDCENLDSLPSKQLILNFFKAISLFRSTVEDYLSNLETPPTCIIADMGLSWTSGTAKKLGIPRIIFHGTCCFSLLCSLLVRKSEVHESVSSDEEPFVVPGIPHRVEVTRAQLPSNFAMKASMKALTEEILASEREARGIIVNSFDGLEREYAELYEREMGKKVWTVGPAFNGRISKEKASLEWLEGKEKGSVLYVCFGSMARFSFEQLVEIALGLELSGQAFVWVISERYLKEETEEWLAGGFEERVRERGLVIKGWADQISILSHVSVGGFLTHCGWNSVLEGMNAGVPMITWPMFADQFFNEKMVLEVAGIGVGVGVKAASVWQEEASGVSVTREEVRRAVEKLMERGGEGERRRNRARELGEKAKMALQEGGSSRGHVRLLVEEMTKLSG